MSSYGLRALVVEDDPSWQQILREILNDCDLAVDLAEGLDQAENLIRATTHRIAILDLSLGGVDHHNQDGLATLQFIRQHDPGCVTIFLTGYATVELAVSVMREYGAYTCLRKETFRRVDFRKVVHEALTTPPNDSNLSAVLRGEEAVLPLTEKQQSVSASHFSSSSELALVIEDDAGWRSLLSELLGDAGYHVQQGTSLVEGLGMLRHTSYKLAVIDLSLSSSMQPGGNQEGYRLLAATHKARIPTIIVSGYANPTDIERAYTEFQLYACLEKQSFDRKLFNETVQRARQQPIMDPLLQSLTEREREVLMLIGRGMTNKEIAQALTITPNTVKRHLKSLFSKLGVNTRSAASAKAAQWGIDKTDITL